jgi:2-keto-3-deoxy-L-rhamnonate aldolase RhmA
MREGLRREWLIVEAEHLERQRQELAAELSAAPANQARAAIKPALTEATHKALRMATGRGA